MFLDNIGTGRVWDHNIDMIKAVVFDCHGVLAGSGFRDTYRAAGGDPEKDKEFIARVMDKYNTGRISPRVLNTLMAERPGISCASFEQIVSNAERPNLDLLKFIRDELKTRYKLAILSNAYTGVVEQLIPAEFLQLFDAVVVSGDVGFVKPQTEIFQLTSNKLAVQFDEMVFVDDLERFTSLAAELGLHTILYKDFATFKSELAGILL
jgi:putative hydrolase of the HAD superfamily